MAVVSLCRSPNSCCSIAPPMALTSTCSRASPCRGFGTTLVSRARGPRVTAAGARTLFQPRCSTVRAALLGGDAGMGPGSGGRCGNGGNGGNGGGSGSGWGAPGDSGGTPLRFGPLLYRALLGGVFLTVVMAAAPRPSHATPGFFSRSGSPPAEPSSLCSSAPTHSGGLAYSLGRSSLGASGAGGSSGGADSAGTGGSGFLSRRRSSAGPSPARPRSKVMHVACKGSTLVVPLPAGGEAHEAAAAAAAGAPPPPALHLPLWQRRRVEVVEAPIQLSEGEARMVACRQCRVRDSLFVQ